MCLQLVLTSQLVLTASACSALLLELTISYVPLHTLSITAHVYGSRLQFWYCLSRWTASIRLLCACAHGPRAYRLEIAFLATPSSSHFLLLPSTAYARQCCLCQRWILSASHCLHSQPHLQPCYCLCRWVDSLRLPALALTALALAALEPLEVMTCLLPLTRCLCLQLPLAALVLLALMVGSVPLLAAFAPVLVDSSRLRL